MNVMAIIGGVVVAVTIAALTFRMFFEDLQGFVESVKYYFQSDWISMFRGELEEDRSSTLKLVAWALLSGGCGIIIYFWLLKLLA